MQINQEYKNKKFKIPIHLALGHESIAVSISEIMDENDRLVLSHRNMAYNLAKVGSLKPILDEYLLKKSGIMEGKVGSMNLACLDYGILYSSSILGNNFSVAVGISMSQKMHSKGITIVLGGDGAIEEGSFHESLLMLQSLQLSSLVIIENNDFSLGTRIHERRHSINLKKFCESYDIKYVKLEKNNPFDYIEILKNLKSLSINSQSPICVEVIVTTLGDWVLETSEYPNGKPVIYHAGPTPSVDLDDGLKPIHNSTDDPIFVLEKLISKQEFELTKNQVLEEVKSEQL